MWDEVPQKSNRVGKEQGNHESSSVSSEHNRCTHVDVYNNNVTNDAAANVYNMVL